MKAILLLALATAASNAQTIDVQSLFQPAPLSGIWKHHAGDDPRWADPAFDDSAWQSVKMPEGAVNPGDGFSWYRFRVRLPENMPGEPLALMLGGIGASQAYEVFVNGQRVGRLGEPDGGPWELLFPTPKAFEIPGYPRYAVIAIRLRTARFVVLYILDADRRISYVGTREAVGQLVETWHGQRLRQVMPQLLISAALLLFGFFFLLLSLWQHNGPEYFWFGLWLISATFLRILNAYPEALALRGAVAHSWALALSNPSTATGWLGLMSSLFGRRITRVAWFAAVAVSVPYPSLAIFGMLGGSLPYVYSRGVAIFSTAMLSLVYYELGWRGTREKERIPAIHISIMGYLMTNMAAFGGALIWNSEAFNASVVLARTVSLLLFTFAMAILMSQRNARLQSERQRLGRELESAAEVQSLLLTSVPNTGDSWQIKPVYLPASEVGGDFYRIFAAGNAAILVVVGDVSGKGLRAAMTVSGLMCAMEAIETREPGLFLTKLNTAAIAHMQSGFATCCAVLLQPKGDTLIANAGHPSPYCDGREVETEPGLPLGILAGVEYPETTVRGERFTFVSDGVVEAANGTGELFGFDRTLGISGQSAHEIAEAAKAWGQNDDITVVTVRRTAS